MQRPELNILERAVSNIFPKWGFRRLQAKTALALAGGYTGASRSKAALRNWNPTVTDANDDINFDLPSLRGRSRDLVRNAPLAGGAINTMVTNVVGTGLSLQSTIDRDYLGMSDEQAEKWQAQVEREFSLWAESLYCDATRAQNFYGLQSLAYRSALESGDVFALTPMLKNQFVPYKLSIQLIEADRVSNPQFKMDTERLVGGIEINEMGEAVACHICNRHPARMRGTGSAEWQRVSMRGGSTGRRNVIHLFDRKRPGQNRGVPVLAPVIEPLKQLGRYTEAELQAAVVSGAFAVFIKMDSEAFNSLFEEDGQKYLEHSMSWDGSIGNNTLDGPGKAVNLLPGESVETTNPGRPNSEFDPFVQAIVRQIGVQLELPFEVLIKHFTSSYSAARAALLDAWRFFRGRREWLSTYFCQPIYETFLEEAIANGRISAPGFFSDPMMRKSYCNAIWIGDGPGSIDPEKEVKAAKLRIETGISTIASESILHDGVDWETKHRQLSREKQMRDEAGLVEEKEKVVEVQAPEKPDDSQNMQKSFVVNAGTHTHVVPKKTIKTPVRDVDGLITHVIEESITDED